MNRVDFLLAVVGPLLAVIAILLASSAGLPNLTASIVLAIVAGIATGIFLARLLARRNQSLLINRPNDLKGNATNFSPSVLEATINEMREGLLVIDHDMRVIASNRAVKIIFSHFE